MIQEKLVKLLKKRFPQARSIYSNDDLQESLYNWKFNTLFKYIIFSEYNTTCNILLCGIVSSLTDENMIEKTDWWKWNIRPRICGYILKWKLGFSQNILELKGKGLRYE